jgi:hypothetical protein
MLAAAVPEPNDGGHGKGDQWCAQKGVGKSAMMLETCYWPAEAPKYIDVRRLSRKGHGQRSVGRSAIETGAAETCAGKEMRDGFHGYLLLPVKFL